MNPYRIRTFLTLILILIIGLPLKSFTQTRTIDGVVVDKDSKDPIPFVSIGIKNKPLGTVSDTLGRFNLSKYQDKISGKDSIIFTCVGYESYRTIWDDFMKSPNTIMLTPLNNVLPIVNISARTLETKKYGREPANIILTPRAYKDVPQISDAEGREQASILKIDKDIVLNRLVVQILIRKEKNITFRMNIYDVKNGLPDKSLLNNNVIFDVRGPREAGISNIQIIDLAPYQIHIKGHQEIALGIEILDRDSSPEDTIRTAFYVPSYPSPFRTSFYRLKSQSRWEEVGNSYLIASIEASVLEKGDYVEEMPENDILAMRVLGKKFGTNILYGNNIEVGQKVKIDNADIYYEVYGSGDPLLLLHGNNEGINSFKEQIEPLSKHFKVIAVDSRGQGNSTNRFKGDYSYELFAADMKQLLDSLNLKKVNILGWSDGGNTGLIMALKYPEYINKLAIMGANAFAGSEALDSAVIKIFEDRSQELSDKTDPASVNQRKLADLVLHEPRLTAQKLESIKKPVLIIAGEHDVVKKEHTDFIHKNISNSRLSVIEGADHYAPSKYSGKFNELIINYFKEQ